MKHVRPGSSRTTSESAARAPLRHLRQAVAIAPQQSKARPPVAILQTFRKPPTKRWLRPAPTLSIQT